MSASDRRARVSPWFAVLLSAWMACAPKGAEPDVATSRVDVAVVPGCPTEPDGTLSPCLWRRAVWAAHLYEIGAVRQFITSGGAAYTPFHEARALAAGMEALGVPASAIHLETQALHTDQNTGYSLALVERLGLRSVAMASEPGHADGMCSMAARWGWSCIAMSIDEPVVAARMAQPLPEVRLLPIPRERWVAEHREPRMATSPRYSSFGHYTKVILKGVFTGSRPPRPPLPEPMLGGSTGWRSETSAP